ncbi:helix-turn-helix domain-containing protein [Texcoconibacillus texcoconensis]|uniref:Transcriptional regulator with XRE-family HTH domain n=1 Tax=Texcoconibacillus texcoconensis TaxID=1095777 RepID=A0A840QTD6_9BACI|nr:helix-turn-helix transcriptional regulator [Texcoconibacillus texcoconensis]MBB5174551.1 transcriptional regulator with XRE-family HTH domain [Texcoconibacillus texcoconensis]
MKPNPQLLFELGNQFKRHRIHQGATQKKIADKANIEVSYLSDIERGLKNPTYDVLVRISRALGTTFFTISKAVEDEVFHNDKRK